MNLFQTERILGGVFDWTWRTSLSASALILLVLLVCRLLGTRLHPLWHYSLWFLVVVRLLLPVAPSASFSLFSTVPSRDPGFVDPPLAGAAAIPEAPVGSWRAPQAPGLWSDKPSGSPAWRADSSWSWRSGGILAWLGGVVACLGQAWRRHCRWRRVLQEGEQIQDPAVLALLRRCAAEVGCAKPVRLVRTSRVGTPAVFGWRRPCLLLPPSFVEDFRGQGLRLVLLHELTHVQRHDVAANWLFVLLRAWHWFNPLVWVACRQFRAARELYCDTLVLRHLDACDRRVYGLTLVKLAETLSSARPSPGLVPVVHRKSELKRRIVMITQPAKAPRLFSFVAVAAMVVLVALTFTGAAEKDGAAPDGRDTEAPPPPVNREKTAERSITALKKTLARIDYQVRAKQEELDALKSHLKVTHFEEVRFYQPDTDAETLRYMERAVIDAKSQYQKLAGLYEQLNSRDRAELRKALPTASPDTVLTALLENQAVYQQQLVLKQTQFDRGHPEIQALEKVLEKIDHQIEERIDGILLGLRTRVRAEEAAVQQSEKRLAEVKDQEIQRVIELRPATLAKRDLESLMLVRERLQLRIMQEEVDAAAAERE